MEEQPEEGQISKKRERPEEKSLAGDDEAHSHVHRVSDESIEPSCYQEFRRIVRGGRPSAGTHEIPPAPESDRHAEGQGKETGETERPQLETRENGGAQQQQRNPEYRDRRNENDEDERSQHEPDSFSSG